MAQADILTGLNDFIGNLDMNFGNPVSIATNLILSTIVGGLVILFVVYIVARKSSENFKPTNAFLLALAINVVNIPIVMGLLYNLLSYIPFLGLITTILPILIWIIFTKLFFKDMSFLHVLIIAIAGFVLSILLIPYLVALVSGFVPV